MRVCLFTDTLADINGVSRFIRNIGEVSRRAAPGRDLHILTSTRLQAPQAPNILNFRPLAARPMPGYPNLELVLPPVRAMLRAAHRLHPDAIHISTPGPVGLVGLLAARRLRVPVLGVYHTDFPAYIDRLFGDPSFNWLARIAMRCFYTPFTTIFTRSDDYAQAVRALGLRCTGEHDAASQDRRAVQLLRLRPGIDTSAFDPGFRDHTGAIWRQLGLGPREALAPKVLYAGRVSVEKDLPLLVRAWRLVMTMPAVQRTGAQLVVVGDGPYRDRMQRELSGCHAHFPGFRHGDELATIYASSDLFIFPSTTDTLGQVVMEAQASGLPVLVSDRGGPKEVVRPGETGEVLPADNTRRWADAIASLLLDDQRRRHMGCAAHRAMRPMSIESSFEHFWAVHERAAQSGISHARGRKKPTTPGIRPRVLDEE